MPEYHRSFPRVDRKAHFSPLSASTSVALSDDMYDMHQDPIQVMSLVIVYAFRDSASRSTSRATVKSSLDFLVPVSHLFASP